MKFFKVLISIVLVIATCVTMMMPASAARVTYYLSDLKMAEADNAEDAKKLLTEAGYEILDKNLNPGGAKAVYLGYKKSTNVDDAITDVRVMNMKGGFNISDYDSIIDEALQTYKKDIDNIRIAAKEFAENYKAGKREAQIAYRQLNYYYVEVDKKQVKMGDYMLSFPEKNEGFADILLKGNPDILNNIRILLSMGVADGGDLIERIKTATADETVYDNHEHNDAAREIAGKIQQLKKLLDSTLAEIDEINADPDMTEEEKEIALATPRYTVTLLAAFDELLRTIPCGDTNYSEYFDTTSKVDYSLLYPFVEAMTAGQRAMAVSGQLQSVLVYNAVEMSDDEVDAELAEVEKDFEPLSVYNGTDMNIIDGALAVTSDALREEAATGNQWFACFTGNMAADITLSSLIGAGGIAVLSVSAHFLRQQYNISQLPKVKLDDTVIYWGDEAADYVGTYNKIEFQMDTVTDLNKYATPIEKKAAIYSTTTTSTSTIVLSSLGVAVGLAMIAFSVYSIVQIVDKYNPKYTKIPSNMIDTVSTANGNRYINYNVVNSLYKDGDKTAEKPGDLNAYDGNQWNAIYYTKSYEAGKCMTATGYFIDSASNFGKYTPVAAFGKNNCYDLNSFNDNESTENIYVAFGNSSNKKTAETSVPTVVGSVFAYSAIAISGVAGMGLGMCLMSAIKRKKEN